MPTIKERIAAETKAAKALLAKGEENLTDEEFEELKAHHNEVKALNERVSLFREASETIDVAKAHKPVSKAATLGDFYAAELKAAGKSVIDTKQGGFKTPEFKAATDTTVTGGSEGAYKPALTTVDTEGVFPYRRQLVVAALFSQGTMTGNAVTYPVYGALEGGSATVGEAAQKPQSHFADPTWQTDSLAEIAVWWKISDLMAEDLPYVVSEINTANDYDVQLKEEDQLLNGDGEGTNIKGLLNRDGIQKVAADVTDADGNAMTPADRLFHARTLISNATGFAPDALVINPLDYEGLRLAKDAQGQYYGGGYFQAPYSGGTMVLEPSPWGFVTVVTPAVAQGTAVVGAFKAGGKVFRKGGRVVESTNSHDTDFTSDKITFRIKERLALQVKYPAAFATVAMAKKATAPDTGDGGNTTKAARAAK